jgi:hypothetical protein
VARQVECLIPSEMIVKMLTHVHKVVITCWCWHIYEGVFKELESLFSTTPEVGKETEANGGHRGDRTLHRTWSWYDRTRPISTAQSRVLGFVTGASGHSQDRRVRSYGQKELRFAEDDRTWGASGHT